MYNSSLCLFCFFFLWGEVGVQLFLLLYFSPLELRSKFPMICDVYFPPKMNCNMHFTDLISSFLSSHNVMLCARLVRALFDLFSCILYLSVLLNMILAHVVNRILIISSPLKYQLHTRTSR